MFKQGWRCQEALASRQSLHPEDSAVPGNSVIKFAGTVQSFTVCLWDEGQRFYGQDAFTTALVHISDSQIKNHLKHMAQRPRVIWMVLVKLRCTERSKFCAIFEQWGPKSAHAIFTEY